MTDHWRVHHLPGGAYPWWAFSPDGVHCGAHKKPGDLLRSMYREGFDLNASSFMFRHEPEGIGGDPVDEWWLAMDAEAGDAPGSRCPSCSLWVSGGDTCAQGCETDAFDAAMGWF